MSAKPFKINIDENALRDFQQRLALVRLPDELEEVGWDYGVPLSDIKRLVTYWKEGFDWRAQEKVLNSINQFTTDIAVDGFGTLNIHFVHQRSTVEGAIPLLFIHGWPGSFIEVTKILPLLTASSSNHPSFHVVAISLPGYTFSEGPKKKGFTLAKHAEVCHKLMLSLNYFEYVTQGGDWGSNISRYIGANYGEKHCRAIHINLLIVAPPSDVDPSSYSEEDKAGLARSQHNQLFEFGYVALQKTKPQTLGYSLADSPVGLLAWIYEKLVSWTGEYPWTNDEILTWISLYWFSRDGPGATLRIYYEHFNPAHKFEVPRVENAAVGVSIFPKDVFVTPLSWASAVGNVVYKKRNSSGGHFASFEEPQKLANDLYEMFGKGGPAYGVVSGKNGY